MSKFQYLDILLLFGVQLLQGREAVVNGLSQLLCRFNIVVPWLYQRLSQLHIIHCWVFVLFIPVVSDLAINTQEFLIDLQWHVSFEAISNYFDHFTQPFSTIKEVLGPIWIFDRKLSITVLSRFWLVWAALIINNNNHTCIGLSFKLISIDWGTYLL